MPLINIEQLVGWYDKDSDHFLCNRCFVEEKNIKKNDYEPIMENEIVSGYMFICDVCGEKFTEI